MKDKGILIQLISVSVCFALLIISSFCIQEQLKAEEAPTMKLIDIPEPTPTIRQLVFQEKTTLPKLTYQKNLSPSQLKMALHQCEQYAIF